MQIYLPIAEMSVNLFLILGLGGLVGFLSGMFGVGGGFMLTPLLIFYGVPPAVAVASQANQITAASVSGALAHFRRGGVDLRMGVVTTVGGAAGSLIGVMVFSQLKQAGQIDLMVRMAYVFFLGIIGALMLWESGRALLRARRGLPAPLRRPDHGGWVHRLPFKMRFRKSRLIISPIAPLLVGALVGFLAAIMGVGGGFVMVPAMIYLLRMPANVVVGTSLFQIVFVTAAVTVLHAVSTQTVDVVLAALLLIGSVVGAQFGVRAGRKLRGEQLRALLALMVLLVGVRMAFSLFVAPDNLFSVDEDIG